MNRIIVLAMSFFAIVTAKAESQLESFNVISDGYRNEIQEPHVVRQINGGSVIIPVFDASCPNDIKAPFAYACKIVEEYMPPCLPLKVLVSCGHINSRSQKVISKIQSRSIENFGCNSRYEHAPMSMIKGVILAEMSHNWTGTYLDSVPDVDFLTQEPDIKIIYNEDILDEISFSLAPDPGEKFDFVSLVIRDLFKGLGITSSYTYDPITNGLRNPTQQMIPFESFINETLGNDDDSKVMLANATKGELLLQNNTKQALKLYAPEVWENGVSLNFFIPQDDCNISNILSYNFCKGMLTRSLEDDYSNFIFIDLLGWKADYPSSAGDNSQHPGGSTSLFMPYNGSITFDADSRMGVNYTSSNSLTSLRERQRIESYDGEELDNYIEAFHPFLTDDDFYSDEGTSVAVLKKDGSWDMVYCTELYLPGATFNMSDWEFHFDSNEYARTIDGYLRGRITLKSYNGLYGKHSYHSTFFVIDYLPQKINLAYKFNKIMQAQESNRSDKSIIQEFPVRIYFSNTEGLNRIVLERLKQGFRLPSKIEITDLQKGYYDTTIDTKTTFTAVGYNNNGLSRSTPITISPYLEEYEPFTLRLNNDKVIIDSNTYDNYNYQITALDSSVPRSEATGCTDKEIDISVLAKGTYVVTVTNENMAQRKSLKFKK